MIRRARKERKKERKRRDTSSLDTGHGSHA